MDLLSEREAAKLLQVKVRTLQQWRWQKRGPRFTKIGGKVRYQREHLEEFLRENTVETNQRHKDRA